MIRPEYVFIGFAIVIAIWALFVCEDCKRRCTHTTKEIEKFTKPISTLQQKLTAKYSNIRR